MLICDDPTWVNGFPTLYQILQNIALGTVAAIARAVAKMAGQDFLFCKKCSATVIRNQHVCSKSGEEMDWDPINKEKVIMCPSCNKEYVHGKKLLERNCAPTP